MAIAKPASMQIQTLGLPMTADESYTTHTHIRIGDARKNARVIHWYSFAAAFCRRRPSAA